MKPAQEPSPRLSYLSRRARLSRGRLRARHVAVGPRISARLALGLGERAQARVLLAAGRAAFEVRAHAGDEAVDVGAGELELDVEVELLEALIAPELRSRRAEQPARELNGLWVSPLHHAALLSRATGSSS